MNIVVVVVVVDTVDVVVIVNINVVVVETCRPKGQRTLGGQQQQSLKV